MMNEASFHLQLMVNLSGANNMSTLWFRISNLRALCDYSDCGLSNGHRFRVGAAQSAALFGDVVGLSGGFVDRAARCQLA